MFRKILCLTCLVFAMALCLSKPASAHVVITDSSGQTGLILHINPDDDPVAGQPSTLFFDMQDKTITGTTNTFVLTAAIAGQPAATLPLTVSSTGGTVAANYTFPVQGVYTLTLVAHPHAGTQAHTFIYSQRIERGTPGATTAYYIPPAWAEMGIIASASGFIALAIIAWNKRKDIAAYSK